MTSSIFGPKKKVARWPVPASLARQGVVVQQPARGHEPGYTFLAYHPLNYAAACKTCNSILKKNYFPIAGTRDTSNSREPAAIAGERPYLLYPIGNLDADPEDLIEFAGLSAQAKASGIDDVQGPWSPSTSSRLTGNGFRKTMPWKS